MGVNIQIEINDVELQILIVGLSLLLYYLPFICLELLFCVQVLKSYQMGGLADSLQLLGHNVMGLWRHLHFVEA